MGKHKTLNLFIDLDDTLVHSSRAYDLAMLEIGIDPNDSVYLEARQQIKQQVASLTAAARNRSIYFKRYLELRNEYSVSRHLQMFSQYENSILSFIQKQWKELHRDELFKELKSHFNKIALVTNETLRMQSLKLQIMDPKSEYFDYLICSEEAGCEKPDHKMFRIALDNLKLKASECIMVGDDFTNDIQPSILLGFHKSIQSFEFKISDELQSSNNNIQKLDELLKN